MEACAGSSGARAVVPSQMPHTLPQRLRPIATLPFSVTAFAPASSFSSDLAPPQPSPD